MADQSEVAQIKELFVNRFNAYVEELNSICNLAGVSQERKNELVKQAMILLDMKSNLLLTELMVNGKIKDDNYEEY